MENLHKNKNVCERYNVSILFNFTIVKENYHQMEAILDLANEYGVQYLNLNPFNDVAVTTLNTDCYDLFYSKEYKDVLNATIKKAKN